MKTIVTLLPILLSINSFLYAQVSDGTYKSKSVQHDGSIKLVLADSTAAQSINGRSYYLGIRNEKEVFFNPKGRTIFFLKSNGSQDVINEYESGLNPLSISDNYIVYSKKNGENHEIRIDGVKKITKPSIAKVEAAVITKDEKSIFFSTRITDNIQVIDLYTGNQTSISHRGLVVGLKLDTVYYVRAQDDLESNLEDLFCGSLHNESEHLLVKDISYDNVSASGDFKYFHLDKYRFDKTGGFFPVIYSRTKGRYALLNYSGLEKLQGPYWSEFSKAFIFYDGNSFNKLIVDPTKDLNYQTNHSVK